MKLKKFAPLNLVVKPAYSKIARATMALGAGVILTACATGQQPDSQQRAILLSIDALNQSILRETLDAGSAPALFNIFDHGACTESARPMFPSVTAAGHAALWTGVYGNVNNISANTVHALPRSEHYATDTISGFSSANLSAEPIWISAGLAGVKVGGHHTTQGPNLAGLPARTGQRSAQQQTSYDRMAEGYALESVQVMNGYNKKIASEAVLSGSDVIWHDQAWANTSQIGVTVEPRAFTFNNPAGTFYGLVYGQNRYDKIALNSRPDVAGAVIIEYAEVENEPLTGRELAQHFSAPLRIENEAGTVFMRARLFDLNANGSDFMLYHSALHVIESSNIELLEAYNNEVQGWIGNSSTYLYRSGSFGTPFYEGGDGTAEARYLETAELLTRVFNTGSEFFWKQRQVDLLVDYFPLGDSIDHTLLAYLDASTPLYSPELAQTAAEFRKKVWQLVDLRVGHLADLAVSGDAALFLAGDHGMTSTWREFYPNRLLQAAGLQVLDAEGQVDLTRSKAVAPAGQWITVNSTEWKGGIVPESEKAAVIADIVAALENLQDSDGQPVIERIYLAEEHSELGMGGAAGGDIYWQEARGYRSSRNARSGQVIKQGGLQGSHSFASTNPAMQTVTCGYGEGFSPKTLPASRLIDVAPTVSDYLNVPAPSHSAGKSLLRDMRK